MLCYYLKGYLLVPCLKDRCKQFAEKVCQLLFLIISRLIPLFQTKLLEQRKKYKPFCDFEDYYCLCVKKTIHYSTCSKYTTLFYPTMISCAVFPICLFFFATPFVVEVVLVLVLLGAS